MDMCIFLMMSMVIKCQMILQIVTLEPSMAIPGLCQDLAEMHCNSTELMILSGFQILNLSMLVVPGPIVLLWRFLAALMSTNRKSNAYTKKVERHEDLTYMSLMGNFM